MYKELKLFALYLIYVLSLFKSEKVEFLKTIGFNYNSLYACRQKQLLFIKIHSIFKIHTLSPACVHPKPSLEPFLGHCKSPLAFALIS